MLPKITQKPDGGQHPDLAGKPSYGNTAQQMLSADHSASTSWDL